MNTLLDAATVLSRASFDKGISACLNRVSYSPELDRSRLQFPEQLLSLYHHPVYRELTDEQRWRLSVLETINFFSLNIHGERALVRDLVARLHRDTPLGDSRPLSEYMQHFIHEENAHTFMLAGYCHRYGAGVLRDLSVPVADPELSPVGEELLVFGRTFVLESFLDYLNGVAMRDETLDDTVRQIHRVHHVDEARHMAFDRSVITACAEQLRNAGRHDELRTIAGLLETFGRYALRRLNNATVYREIGVPDAVQVTWALEGLDPRKRVTDAWLSSARTFLQSVRLTP